MGGKTCEDGKGKKSVLSTALGRRKLVKRTEHHLAWGFLWTLSECVWTRVCVCVFFFFLKSLILFIYLLIIFGCVGSLLLRAGFSSCGERGLLFVAVCGLLIAVDTLVAEHGL